MRDAQENVAFLKKHLKILLFFYQLRGMCQMGLQQLAAEIRALFRDKLVQIIWAALC